MNDFVKNKTYQSLVEGQKKIARNLFINITIFLTIGVLVFFGSTDEKMTMAYISVPIDYLSGTSILIVVFSFFMLRHQIMFVHIFLLTKRTAELVYGHESPYSFWSIQYPSFVQILGFTPVYPSPIMPIGVFGSVLYGLIMHFGVVLFIITIHIKVEPSIFSFLCASISIILISLSHQIMDSFATKWDASSLIERLDFYDSKLFSHLFSHQQ